MSSMGGKLFSDFLSSQPKKTNFFFIVIFPANELRVFFCSGEKVLILIATGRKIIESGRGQ